MTEKKKTDQAKNKPEFAAKNNRKSTAAEQTFDAKKGVFVDGPVERKAIEKWEEFYSKEHHGFMFMYEFTTAEGKSFTCESRSLEDARKQRDEWMAE